MSPAELSAKERVMLTIMRPQVFRERIADGPRGVEVSGYLGADAAGREVFRFEPGRQLAELLGLVLQRFRERGAQLKGEVPAPSDTGTWYVAESGSDRWIASASEVEKIAELRSALHNLDRSARLAPQCIKNWLDSATASLAAGNPDLAFRQATAALESSRLPHLEIAAKDESTLKVRAAQSTFSGGKKAEGVAMVMRLAEARLKLIEKTWQK